MTKSLAHAPDTVKISTLAAGKSRTVKLKVPVKKGAKLTAKIGQLPEG